MKAYLKLSEIELMEQVTGCQRDRLLIRLLPRLGCRVSTTDQNPENQRVVLTDWAKQRDFEVISVYEEEESAWKSGHQRQLARMLDDARRRRFSIMLVWSLDRLSREGALAILSLVHRLSTYGVKVISYQESWTEAPGELGELLYALAGWVARMESQRRSERTKAGLTRAKIQGKKLGRPVGAKDHKKRRRRKPSVIYTGSLLINENPT